MTERKWHALPGVRYGAVAAVALILGTVIGTATAGSVESDPKYLRAQDALAQKDAALEQGVAALEQAGAALESIEGDLPAREQAVSELQAALVQREQQVVGQEKDLATREQAVSAVEQRVADNTIPGDGTYLVGDDMRPGDYRSNDNVGCYWSVSSDAGGANLINNDIGDGTRFAQVSAGQYFESQGCSDWVLQ